MFNSVTLWFVVGILLLLSEFLIPGFTIFFFGVGALFTSLLLLILPPLQGILWLQILIFTLLSIVSLITLRRRFSNSLRGELFKERTDYLGQECVVVEAITPKKMGRIRYQGTTWTASAVKDSLRKNQKGIIVGKQENDPLVFIIEKK
ncbi:MAG: hypothetical protein B6229_04000 [Spirochaetaceae bacterium 4572_7]|nr:MAG: hypothetical protein B6229_04000 [Spirochaetaceae bacterium 4572_7]